MPGPLEGLRVIELAHERTAFAGKLLADAGADLRLLEPRDGCAQRRHAPFVEDRPDSEGSLSFWHYNTSKRGITLDLDTARGRELAREEVLDDPHFRARGFPVEVEHPELGRAVTYPGAPYRFLRTPWRISRRAPRLGEHNAEIYAELGLDIDALDALRAQGVL